MSESPVLPIVKIVEVPYSVQVPVFKEVVVDVPKYVDFPVQVPTGYEAIIDALAYRISDKIYSMVQERVIKDLSGALDKVLDERLTQVRVPKIIEEVKVNERVIEVERVTFKDVEVERPIFQDKVIINPILKNVEVTNPVLVDKPVLNCIITDINVTNAIIKEVEVEVMKPRYVNEN